MIPDRRRKVEAIFLEVAEADAPRRAPLLDERCAGDPALRAEVASLLDHHDESGEFLNDAEALAVSAGLVARGPAVEEPRLPAGSSAGGYTIKEVVGSGGMGVVYLAEQARPRRTVALKVIRRGFATQAIIRRFEHEAEVLGRLHHAGIAQIFEAGAAEFDPRAGPQAFIAMEFVKGVNLCEHADTRRLGTRERLELMIRVCDAVQHAHQRGVIHRDLKPANIIVEETPGQGPAQPKILDFGVARATDADISVTTLQTSVGQLIGTLPYMSPEQVLADPREIDTRSDVYSLGVILYQLLTSKLPHDVGSRSIPEAARVIRDEKPARLSSISKVFRGEIETIVAKSLEKDRERRYQSAADLGEDLRRHLHGLPIAAKDDSALYVLRKQIKRYQGVIAAVCVLIILLSIFAVYASVQAERSEALAVEESHSRTMADAARDAAERARARAETERTRADAEAERLRRSLYFNRIGFAHAAYLGNDAVRVRQLLDECPDDLRGWEWWYLGRLADRSLFTLPLFEVGRAALPSADRSTLVASGFRAGKIDMLVLRLSSADPPAVDTVLPILSDVETATSALSPDGRALAVGGLHGELWMYDAAGGGLLATGAIKPATPVDQPALLVHDFSPDGRRLLVGTYDGAVHVVDTATLAPVLVLPPKAGLVARAVFTPDGSTIVTGTHEGLRPWNADDGKEGRLIASPSARMVNLALDPSGARAATSDYDLRLRLWDLGSGEMLWEAKPHGAPFDGLAFAPDGSTIATACDDSTAKIIDAASGKILRVLRGHVGEVSRVTYSADGRHIITSSRDGTLKWWSASLGPEVPTINLGGWGSSVAFSPDGARIAVATGDGSILMHDAATLARTALVKAHEGIIYRIEFSPDSSELVTASGADGLVKVWNAEAITVKRQFTGPKGLCQAACFGPGPARVTSCGDDGYVRIWDTAGGAEVLSFRAHDKPIIRVEVSPDGKLIATASRDHTVRLFDAATGSPLRTCAGHTNEVYALAFRPGTTELASSSEDATIRIWDTSTGECRRVLVGTSGPVFSVDYSHDGRRLATSGWDCGLRLWDADSGEQILYSRGHLFLVFAVAFSPDGRRIITTSQDSTARLWESSATH